MPCKYCTEDLTIEVNGEPICIHHFAEFVRNLALENPQVIQKNKMPLVINA